MSASPIVTIISPGSHDLFAPGVRALSSYLKMHGYRTRLMVLPGRTDRYVDDPDYVYQYTDKVIQQIVDLSSDSLLVGLSFMTPYYDRAVQITRAVKERLEAPVVWGGIHATCQPEEALGHADAVILGEGERPLLELVQRLEQGEDYSDIANLCCKKEGRMVRNPIRPLIEDLDSLPYFDYQFENHYVLDLDEQAISELDYELYKERAPRFPNRTGQFLPTYKAMITRGCPHSCNYCGNSYLRNLYHGGGRYFRRRSNESMIEELVQMRKHLDFIRYIKFQDDNFFATSLENIQEFAAMYKEKVGLPFEAQGSPDVMDEEKLAAMVDAGQSFTEIGIQAGSEHILSMYGRKGTGADILAAAHRINKYKDRMNVPDFHVILDNPWETIDDLKATLKITWELPKPYNLLMSGLIFYPGTPLYKRALDEGLIKEGDPRNYHRHLEMASGCYINFLFYISSINNFPRWLLRLMASDIMIACFNRKPLNPLFAFLQKVVRKINMMKWGMLALYRGGVFTNIRYYKRIFGSFWK